MVDTWEIFGRLATDATFRTAVLAAPFTGKYRVIGDRMRIEHPDFVLAETRVRDVIKGRPLSLKALGELIVALTYPSFRTGIGDLGQAIAAKFNTSGRDWRFYACLGAMVFDKSLANSLKQNAQAFNDRGFLGTPQDYPNRNADIQTLQAMFNATDNPAITLAADASCLEPWADGCDCRVEDWDGHLHQLENPIPLAAILRTENSGRNTI